MSLLDQPWKRVTSARGTILLCWLLCTPGCGLLHAQPQGVEGGPGESGEGQEPSTRQELLRQRRLDRRKSLQPHRPEFFEKLLTQYDRGRYDIGGNSGYRGFYPRFARIAEGSGLAGGLGYVQPEIWGDVGLSASASYSVKGYSHFEVRMGVLPDSRRGIPRLLSEADELNRLTDISGGSSGLRVYLTGRRRLQPQVAYFGSGSASRRSNETNFFLRDTLAQLTLEYQFGRRLLGRIETGFLQHSLGAGRRASRPTTRQLFDDQQAPGLDDPPNYWRSGGSLILDYRDNPGVPHQGFAVAFGWSRYHQVPRRHQFDFQRYEVDARGFVPLGSRQRVLALRFLLLTDRAADGNRVPFFLQGPLGGRHTLRGFDRFRLRGEKLMLYQAEYRWEPSRRFELAIFADTGAVATNQSRLSFSDLRSDFGVGFRVRTSQATVFRLEQAWSREGAKTILSLSASF